MKTRGLIILACICTSIPSAVFAQTGADTTTAKKGTAVYRVHKVLKGETLSKIARQYGCTVDELRKLNKNTEPLMIGAKLNIPAAKTASANTETKPAPPVTPTITPEVTKPTETAAMKVHSVVSGETLSKIAAKYTTTVADLKKVNNLSSDALRIGQKLYIPNTKAAVTVKPSVAKQLDSSKATPAPKVEVNTTKPADNTAKNVVKPNTSQAKDVNPGIPEKATPANQVITENITEKEEVGKARVIKGKMDDTRTYAMHPSIPKGNIVVVIHPASGRMAYCKIVENYTPNQYEGSGIVITPAVAQKIGLSGTLADVKIKYAAP